MKATKPLTIFLTLLALMLSMCAPALAYSQLEPCDFTDVPSERWYAPYVGRGVKLGLINGVTETSFVPQGQVTRAQAAALIHRLLTGLYDTGGWPVINQVLGFTDIREEAWYTSDVIWCQLHGILRGYPDGSFRPDAAVSRQEFAKILAAAVPDLPDVPEILTGDLLEQYVYADWEDTSSWARDSFLRLWTLDSIYLFGPGTLKPRDPISRAEAAKLLVRVYQLLQYRDALELYCVSAKYFAPEEYYRPFLPLGPDCYRSRDFAWSNQGVRFLRSQEELEGLAADLNDLSPVYRACNREYDFQRWVHRSTRYLPERSDWYFHPELIPQELHDLWQVLPKNGWMDRTNLPGEGFSPEQILTMTGGDETFFDEYAILAVDLQRVGQPAWFCKVTGLSLEGDTVRVSFLGDEEGGTTADISGMLYFFVVPKETARAEISMDRWIYPYQDPML